MDIKEAEVDIEAPYVDPDIEPEPELSDTLTATDRCDYCGVQAYVGVIFEIGDLLFCGHHYAKWESKIADTAIQVFDERYKLLPKPFNTEDSPPLS